MKLTPFIVLLSLSLASTAPAQLTEPVPNNDPYFTSVYLLKAPRPQGPVLRLGDRLAICGDSITEQRMYSRIMETYLTVALPELDIRTRQYGWSGEQASGFLHRMTNDVLRFHPTVATTCYGMNDFHYRPYELAIGQAYASNMTDTVAAFEDAGARVVVGSPGCMGFSKPSWGNFVKGSFLERSASLCALRDIDINLSQVAHTGFADVFWTMYDAQYLARQRFGTNYTLAGKDSVHPGWAGHLIMAYAFLKALDVPGDIGSFTVDLSANKVSLSPGHELVSFIDGALTIRSRRYPFCATGEPGDPDSIRSGMTLVPFNDDLNRLILIVKGAKAKAYQITWGPKTRRYTAERLEAGVNLADDFDINPFSEAFAAVDQAVAKKQAFETDQIKNQFHGAAGKADMVKTVADTEQQRAPLAAAIQAAFVPVTHTIFITPQ